MMNLELARWQQISFGERWVINVCGILLCLLRADERITVCMTLLGDELVDLAEPEGEIDALLEAVKMRIKLMRSDT